MATAVIITVMFIPILPFLPLLLAIITATINSNHIGVYTRDIKGMHPRGRAPERLNQVIQLIRIQRLLQEAPG